MLDMVPEFIKDTIPNIIIAAFGGLVATLNTPNTEERSLPRFLIDMLTAIFAGLMTHLMMTEFNVSYTLRSVSVGIAGWQSKPVLSLIEKRIFGKLKG